MDDSVSWSIIVREKNVYLGYVFIFVRLKFYFFYGENILI